MEKIGQNLFLSLNYTLKYKIKSNFFRFFFKKLEISQLVISKEGKNGRVEGWKDGRVEGWKGGRVEGWVPNLPIFQPSNLPTPASNLPTPASNLPTPASNLPTQDFQPPLTVQGYVLFRFHRLHRAGRADRYRALQRE